MGSECSNSEELNKLVEKARSELMPDYYDQFSDALEGQKVFSELDHHGDVPLEFWTAFAQVLADASGYRVTLQAAILEPLREDADKSRIVGHREVMVAEPNLFVRPT
jgi:hypothetical protein